MDNRPLHRAINRVETLECQRRGILLLGMGLSVVVVVLSVAQITGGLSMGNTSYVLFAAVGVNMVAFYVWGVRVVYAVKQAGEIIKMRVSEIEHRYEKLANARLEIQVLIGDAMGSFTLLCEKLPLPPSGSEPLEPSSKSMPQKGDPSSDKNAQVKKKPIKSSKKAPYAVSKSLLVNKLRMMEHTLYLLEARYNDAEDRVQAERIRAAHILEKMDTATKALMPVVSAHIKKEK